MKQTFSYARKVSKYFDKKGEVNKKHAKWVNAIEKYFVGISNIVIMGVDKMKNANKKEVEEDW